MWRMAQHSEHKMILFWNRNWKWILNWVLSLRMDTAHHDSTKENKSKHPKHIETRSERLKVRIETTKQKTRHTDVHREPVSPGIVSHPFSYMILTSLGPQALIFWKSPILTFSLVAHLSILQSLIFHPSPGWLMDKLEIVGSCPWYSTRFLILFTTVSSSHRGAALQLGV